MGDRSKHSDGFRFTHAFRIGERAAELDRLLDECFIPTEFFEILRDKDEPRCCVVGRSGTGKTALLERLAKESHSYTKINPNILALQFLSDSDLINTLRRFDVGLDYFYKLLWRHVFVVEILKLAFPDQTKEKGLFKEVVHAIQRTIRLNVERDRAIEYLDKWGANFFKPPQERVRQIHETLEKRIAGALGATGGLVDWLNAKLGVEGEVRKSKTVDEIIRTMSNVVSSIQVQDLDAVKDFVKEKLGGRDQTFYLFIDDLDKFSGEPSLVFELIRALILEIWDWNCRKDKDGFNREVRSIIESRLKGES